MSEFSNESPFYQASRFAGQMKLIEDNQNVEEMVEKAERISAAMSLDLNSIYDALNVVVDMVDDAAARRAIEDIRDEVYRCMR